MNRRSVNVLDKTLSEINEKDRTDWTTSGWTRFKSQSSYELGTGANPSLLEVQTCRFVRSVGENDLSQYHSLDIWHWYDVRIGYKIYSSADQTTPDLSKDGIITMTLYDRASSLTGKTIIALLGILMLVGGEGIVF